MAQLDKDILIISAPQEPNDYPVWPGYTPLWDDPKVRQSLEALVAFRGNGANPVINESDVITLIVRITNEYDQVLSKAQFELWQANGLLHGKGVTND